MSMLTSMWLIMGYCRTIVNDSAPDGDPNGHGTVAVPLGHWPMGKALQAWLGVSLHAVRVLTLWCRVL